MHLPDIPNEDRLPVDVFDRDVVEIGDCRGHRIGAHRVLRVADLGEPGGQRQIVGVDRVHDVRRGQAPGLEFDRVDVDHDLPELAAVWIAIRNTPLWPIGTPCFAPVLSVRWGDEAIPTTVRVSALPGEPDPAYD
jgi:hypothetical protein